MRTKVNTSGVGIIEVIVALSLVGILSVSIGSVLSATYRLYRASEYKTQAFAYAQEPLEIINGIKLDLFVCSCNSDFSSLYSCSGGICTRTADGQTCTPLEDYTSCWTTLPAGFNAATQYQLVESGGAWQLSGLIPGSRETIIGNPSFTRSITITNVNRNASGDIDPAGTADINTKQVTVTVYWTERSEEKNISLSQIFTAWENI